MNDEPRTTMNGKPVFTVPSKTVINFKSHFDKKLLCDGMTFSTGMACTYSCSFCYVESMMLKQQEWLKQHGVTGSHFDHVVRRDNPVEIARKQLMSVPEAKRQTKQVIYASPLVEVAGNMELVRETVELCKVILKLTNWDIRLLSKSNLLPKVATMLNDEYDGPCSPVHHPKRRIIYGVSTGTLDDKLAAAFEEGTPKVSKRIESLHWLQDNGFRTFGMVCPNLPQWLPGNSAEIAYVHFARDMAKAIRVDRCEQIWAEVINVRGESFTRTEKCLRDAGYGALAYELSRVSHDKHEWEKYARLTFEAHTKVIPGSKLRFLQYVNKSNEAYWKANVERGAVLL